MPFYDTEQDKTFDTYALTSLTTGILMGDIGGVYGVMSHLIGRPAFTHELSFYADPARAVLLTCHPDLPESIGTLGWQAVLARTVKLLGPTLVLPSATGAILAEDRSPEDTLTLQRKRARIRRVDPDMH